MNAIYRIGLFLLLIPFALEGQKTSFRLYTPEDGLQSSGRSGIISMDNQGIIWLTENGKLLFFDSRRFRTYPSRPDTLPGIEEPIQGAYPFQDSLLFICTHHSAYLLDPYKKKWQSIPWEKQVSNTSRFLHHVYQEDGLTVLVTTKDGKKSDTIIENWQFDGRQIRPYSTPALFSKYSLLDFDIHQRDTFLTFDHGLIVKIDHLSKETTQFNLPQKYRGKEPIKMVYVSNDTFLLMHEYLFYWLSPTLDSLIPHPINRHLEAKVPPRLLSNFLLEPSGNIWACGRYQSFIYYDSLKDTLYDFNDQIVAQMADRNDYGYLLQDLNGIVWVGTHLGLLKVTRKSLPIQTFFSKPDKTTRKFYSFRGISEDENGQVFSNYYRDAFEDLLVQLHPVQKKIPIKFRSNLVDSPFGLQCENSRIWLSSGNYYNLESGGIHAVQNAIPENGDNGLFSYDHHGELWWAHKSKLFWLDRSTEPWSWVEKWQAGHQFREITNAFHLGTHSHKLWFGGPNQLVSYHPDTGLSESFFKEDFKLPINTIMSILEQDNGKLWLGTDVGLIEFDPSSKDIRQYTMDNGLPNDMVAGILPEGDSCLWLSTFHGLSRFHISTEQFINFYEEDGLTDDEFNRASYFKASDNRFYFGTLRGMNAFYPDKLIEASRQNNKSAKLLLTAFERVDEKHKELIREPLIGEKEIDLYFWDRSFTFEFALLDYTQPEEVSYTYIMEGYESQWSNPSKYNFARFSSLPTGNYTFRVKARDHKGFWHPNELAVKIVVHPPWWQTWYAYLSYLIVITGLAYLIISFFIKRKLLKQDLEKEQEEALRLKELDSFKSRLYTNLTHEFRTPLSVILGMAEQIRSNPKTHLKEGLQLIDRNGRHLLQLINQLLDLSKLESNSFQLQLRQGDIIPYLRYVTESFQTYANGRNLSLQFFTTLELMVMDYDPEQIKQIMTNLISNAVKFTASGGSIKVRISKEGDYLQIDVIDTGIGIAEKDLVQIFDRFYQVDGSITRKGEGTGIGLAHTQELVKLMEGKIHVESKLQQGSTFTVLIPIHQNAEPLLETPKIESVKMDHLVVPVAINKSDLISSTNDLPKLLIIEDNPDVVHYLKSCLKEGYQLEVAFNGAIGIEKAFEIIPDLVISDVMMPGKDGYEVCDILKNDERTSHIPIILLTAKADADSRLSGLKVGADAYLAKPFDKTELLVRLEMLVKKQQKLTTYFARKFQEGITSNLTVEEAAIAPKEQAFIQKIGQVIEDNYSDENFSLPQLCLEIGMSRSQLYRKIKALTNKSPSDFIRKYRLEKAKALLTTEDLTVNEVAWKVGFKDTSHFSKSFYVEFGFRPGAINK